MGHLAFKTIKTSWLNASQPVLVLISVHSHFHHGADGSLKMEAFLSTIKSCVQGNIAILVADTAHLQTRQLLEGAAAKENCLRSARELVQRYHPFFTGCELLYWNTLCQESVYVQARSHILSLFHSDGKFRNALVEDVEGAYTENRAREFPDKVQFIEKSLADLLEQCISLQVLAERGYRYLFYPGSPCRATEYLNTVLPNPLEWIDVFITIEKKTRLRQVID